MAQQDGRQHWQSGARCLSAQIGEQPVSVRALQRAVRCRALFWRGARSLSVLRHAHLRCGICDYQILCRQQAVSATPCSSTASTDSCLRCISVEALMRVSYDCVHYAHARGRCASAFALSGTSDYFVCASSCTCCWFAFKSGAMWQRYPERCSSGGRRGGLGPTCVVHVSEPCWASGRPHWRV